MKTAAEKIIEVLKRADGTPDRELAHKAFGKGANAPRATNECTHLANLGLIERKLRPDGVIGNYLTEKGRRTSS